VAPSIFNAGLNERITFGFLCHLTTTFLLKSNGIRRTPPSVKEAESGRNFLRNVGNVLRFQHIPRRIDSNVQERRTDNKDTIFTHLKAPSAYSLGDKTTRNLN
jgi:hypothetical protein